jgi:hypothetical protein
MTHERKSFAAFLSWFARDQVPVDGMIWEPAGALKFTARPLSQKTSGAGKPVSDTAQPVASTPDYCASCP